MWHEFLDKEDKEALEKTLKTLNEFKDSLYDLGNLDLYEFTWDDGEELSISLDVFSADLYALETGLKNHIKLIDRFNNGELKQDEDGDLIRD